MIAEFMLHRTRAGQVERVYSEFIKKYPDVKALSIAGKNDIENITEHLGLHWRSAHFIKSARFIVREYNSVFPDNREKLLKIPGVGDYVAGAIMTVCFNKPEYVVDSNIARFINRFYGLNLTGEIRRKKAVIDRAKELFKIKNSGVLSGTSSDPGVGKITTHLIGN
jgi:A/G-specific adenine glycosylase